MRPILASELDDIFDDEDIIEIGLNKLYNNNNNIIYSIEGTLCISPTSFYVKTNENRSIGSFSCSIFSYRDISEDILINYSNDSGNFFRKDNIYNINMYDSNSNELIFYTKCRIKRTGKLYSVVEPNKRFFARFDTIEPEAFNYENKRFLDNFENNKVSLTIEERF